MILIEQLITGNVICKLSNINKIFPKTIINECIEGIKRQNVIPKKAISTRKSHINFCRGF